MAIRDQLDLPEILRTDIRISFTKASFLSRDPNKFIKPHPSFKKEGSLILLTF